MSENLEEASHPTRGQKWLKELKVEVKIRLSWCAMFWKMVVNWTRKNIASNFIKTSQVTKLPGWQIRIAKTQMNNLLIVSWQVDKNTDSKLIGLQLLCFNECIQIHSFASFYIYIVAHNYTFWGSITLKALMWIYRRLYFDDQPF